MIRHLKPIPVHRSGQRLAPHLHVVAVIRNSSLRAGWVNSQAMQWGSQCDLSHRLCQAGAMDNQTSACAAGDYTVACVASSIPEAGNAGHAAGLPFHSIREQVHVANICQQASIRASKGSQISRVAASTRRQASGPGGSRARLPQVSTLHTAVRSAISPTWPRDSCKAGQQTRGLNSYNQMLFIHSLVWRSRSSCICSNAHNRCLNCHYQCATGVLQSS